jgi:hypothetical protein
MQTTAAEASGGKAAGVEATGAGAGGGIGRDGRELSAVQPIDNNRADTIGPSFTVGIS